MVGAHFCFNYVDPFPFAQVHDVQQYRQSQLGQTKADATYVGHLRKTRCSGSLSVSDMDVEPIVHAAANTTVERLEVEEMLRIHRAAKSPTSHTFLPDAFVLRFTGFVGRTAIP